MKITRIFSDETGESHFEDIDVPFEEVNYVEGAPPFSVSKCLMCSFLHNMGHGADVFIEFA